MQTERYGFVTVLSFFEIFWQRQVIPVFCVLVNPTVSPFSTGTAL